jgi:hypothetical protein
MRLALLICLKPVQQSGVAAVITGASSGYLNASIAAQVLQRTLAASLAICA